MINVYFKSHLQFLGELFLLIFSLVVNIFQKMAISVNLRIYIILGILEKELKLFSTKKIVINLIKMKNSSINKERCQKLPKITS